MLQAFTEHVMDLAGPQLRPLLRNPEMLVIVSSTNRITPFHMDGECNFLVQIQGHKTVWLYNRNDRTVLTEEEIERFYTVDGFAATFKDSCMDRAREEKLTAGQGVHIPVLFPHWVQNGNEVSVSLSINYEFPEEYRADIYRVNWFLRRRGLRPGPPGQSKVIDTLKVQSYRSFKAVRGLLSRG